jgi:hypothetical protein
MVFYGADREGVRREARQETPFQEHIQGAGSVERLLGIAKEELGKVPIDRSA